MLIEPGTYDEEMLVTSEHAGIHIRGMNRNTVIVDGQHKAGPEGANGIEVFKTSNVSIENLTVRNFDRASTNGEFENSATPTFNSTEIERCTIFRNNVFEEDNNINAPGNAATEAGGWGIGVELPGTYADLLEKNTIRNNVNVGLLGFEYPNPFPIQEDTIFFAFYRRWPPAGLVVGGQRAEQLGKALARLLAARRQVLGGDFVGRR